MQHAQHSRSTFATTRWNNCNIHLKRLKTGSIHMQHREGEGRGSNREIGLRTAPWQAPWIYVEIRQSEHSHRVGGVADGYLCRAALDLMEPDLVKVVDILAVPDGHHLLLLLARRRRWWRGQHVVLPLDRAAASTARRGWAERSRGVGGRERKWKWREASRQMG
jgi:hypothetical protein